MLHDIKDVEIFATGKWNDTEFKDKDIDSIVSSFGQDIVGFEPPLKLGHTNKQKLLQKDGLPAAGWIANLKKTGSKLLADFKDVPETIFQLLKKKAYKTVSAEIYQNYKNKEGKTFPWVLKAVSLLGEDIPAIEGLKDILALTDDDNRQYFVFDYEKKFNNEGRENNMPTKEEELTRELKEKNKMITDLQKRLAALENNGNEKKLSNEIEVLSKSLEKTSTSLKETTEKLEKEVEARKIIELNSKKKEIDIEVAKFVSDRKITPAQAPLLKEILLKSDDSKILAFEKDGKEEKLSTGEAITKFMSLQTEIFSEETLKQGIDGDDEEAKILAYCKANNLDPKKKEDYSEAFLNALN